MEADLARFVNPKDKSGSRLNPSGSLPAGLDPAFSFGFWAFMDFLQNPILQKERYTTKNLEITRF